MERTDELYIRVKELEEKAKRLQAEKQRLEMKMRGQHGSMWPMRTGTVLMPPNTPGFYGPQTPGPLTPSGNPVSPVRRNYLPTTPGAPCAHSGQKLALVRDVASARRHAGCEGRSERVG